MQAKYDSKAKALYLTLKKGNVASTIKLKDDVVVDVDKSGNVLGVEVLNPPISANQTKKQHSILMAVTCS